MGVIKGLSKNILKQGVGKGKMLFVGGKGVGKVSPPLPAQKILIIHLST